MLCLSPKQHAKMLYCLDVFRNLRKSSEHLRAPWVRFESHRNTFGNLWQSSEVIRNFSEIWVIWIRKSHAFDLGKVGRYTFNQQQALKAPFLTPGSKAQSLGSRMQNLWPELIFEHVQSTRLYN